MKCWPNASNGIELSGPNNCWDTCSCRRYCASASALLFCDSYIDQGEAFPSPDGKKLVYEVVVSGIQQIFTMNVDGSGSAQITHDGFNHDTPSWSRDGKKIAYVSDKDGKEVIHLVNPDGSGYEQLTDDKHRYIHPNWSADSSKVIYCSDDDLKPPKKNESDIFAIDVTTRKALTLVTGGTNTYPRGRPTGRRLCFGG
jgi:TolB protein